MQELVQCLFPRLFFSGVGLALIWFALLCAAQIWKHAWNWIDDGDSPIQTNPIIARIMMARGYEYKCPYDYESDYRCWVNDKGYRPVDEAVIFVPAGVLLFAPIALALAANFYPIPIAVGVLAAIAYVARFARRSKKLFDKHVKDPIAHKKQGNEG